jgi:hypothetical protein
MAWVGSTVTAQVLSLLSAPQGVNGCLSTLATAENLMLGPVAQPQIQVQNVSAELAERSENVVYPVLYVYCDKVLNQLIEKFRTFSGKATMVIEVRVSQDRLDGLEDQTQSYVDAVTQVLDQNRGDWGEGMYYAGGYQAVFAQVKHGGRNFLQSAKVMFDVGVSD